MRTALVWTGYVLLVGPLYLVGVAIPVGVSLLLASRVRQQAMKATRGRRLPPLSHVTDNEIGNLQPEPWPSGWPALGTPETATAVRCHAYARLAQAVSEERELYSEFLLLAAGAALGVTVPHLFASDYWRVATGLAFLPASFSVALRLSASQWRRRSTLYAARGRTLENS